MEKKSESTKFKDQEEYRHYHMQQILMQVEQMTPIFQRNYMKSLMKQRGINNRYLPPNFKKEEANADVGGTEGATG